MKKIVFMNIGKSRVQIAKVRTAFIFLVTLYFDIQRMKKKEKNLYIPVGWFLLELHSVKSTSICEHKLSLFYYL